MHAKSYLYEMLWVSSARLLYSLRILQKDQPYLDVVDGKEAGIMFLLKNLLSVTRGLSLFHFWITFLLTQLDERFSSDQQRVVLGLSCDEGRH